MPYSPDCSSNNQFGPAQILLAWLSISFMATFLGLVSLGWRCLEPARLSLDIIACTLCVPPVVACQVFALHGKALVILRSTLSNVRHNGMVSERIVSTISIVRIFGRCRSSTAGCLSGGSVIVATAIPPSKATFTQLQNLQSPRSKSLPLFRG